MNTNPTVWTAILAPLIAGLAALAGALGTQWQMRKSQREQHSQEISLQGLAWQREDHLHRRAAASIPRFMAACDSLLYDSAVQQLRDSGLKELGSDVDLAGGVRRILGTIQKIRLLGSRNAVAVALRVQKIALELSSSTIDNQSQLGGIEYRKTYDEFVDIARADLAADQVAHTALARNTLPRGA